MRGNFQQPARDQVLLNATLITMRVWSLTMGTYLPSPTSERLTDPVARNPMMSSLLSKGLGPPPMKVALSTTGKVTLCTG